MSRSDPIRDRYFEPVEQAELISDVLFYAGAGLSIVVLFVDKAQHPAVHDWLWVAFALVVVALFLVGIVLRLHWTPRAADERNRDFLSSAWRVNITPERTEGYYNNEHSIPTHRMAANVLENSHFTKAIAARMTRWERAKVGIYLAAWLICVLMRQTNLDLIVAGAQALFSEQLLSKWIRLEWLRSRAERTFDTVFRLFQTTPGDAEFDAMAVEAYVFYETSKANAAVTLSSKFFGEMNGALSAEWQVIKAKLKIQA